MPPTPIACVGRCGGSHVAVPWYNCCAPFRYSRKDRSKRRLNLTWVEDGQTSSDDSNDFDEDASAVSMLEETWTIATDTDTNTNTKEGATHGHNSKSSENTGHHEVAAPDLAHVPPSSTGDADGAVQSASNSVEVLNPPVPNTQTFLARTLQLCNELRRYWPVLTTTLHSTSVSSPPSPSAPSWHLPLATCQRPLHTHTAWVRACACLPISLVCLSIGLPVPV